VGLGAELERSQVNSLRWPRLALPIEILHHDMDQEQMKWRRGNRGWEHMDKGTDGRLDLARITPWTQLSIASIAMSFTGGS
jgi:hypothetical protein